MLKKLRVDYEVEDFLTDESFINFHFGLNTKDELSWTEWLAGNPGKKDIVREARELILTLSLTVSDEEYRIEYKKIRNAIDKKPPPGFQFLNWDRIPLLHKRRIKSLKYILPALLIFIAVVYFFLHKPVIPPTQLTETVNNQPQPLVINLSDSSVVTLAPRSALRYPLHFTENKRNVYLDGEAQFEVKRNEQAPFKVYSENIVATVLGTVFKFKKSADSITVELFKGKLNVELKDKSSALTSILLNPAEKAIYVKHDQAFYKTAVTPVTPVTPLINVSFRQNNFEEIAAQIKYASGITVINRSNKKAWRFTGEFKNTTAKEIIDNIGVIKGLSVEVQRDTIYVK